MRVSELVALYLRHAEAVGLFSAESAAERGRTFAKFLKSYGTREITSLRPYELEDWIESQPGWKSTSTRKAKCNQVNALFNWAAKKGRVSFNPFRGTSYPEADPRPCLDDDNLGVILEASNKAFERIVWFLRLTAACRMSEVCGLVWERVNLERGELLVPRAKNGKPKVVVLHPQAVELLRQMKDYLLRLGLPEEAFAAWPVFTNSRGTAWNRHTLGQQLRRMKRRLGLSIRASLHGLRHQGAHTALIHGADIGLVSAWLGHRGIAVTLRYYGHLQQNPEALREVARKAGP